MKGVGSGQKSTRWRIPEPLAVCEAILAVIVLASGSDLAAGGGEDALIDHCRRFIGGYKVPRRFRFVDALAKNAMGKILKAELRRRYGNG